MNSIITRYRKIAFLLVAVIAMGSNAIVFAECKPCVAAAAEREAHQKSVQAAHAASIAAGKPAAKPSKSAQEMELDEIDEMDADEDQARAAREELSDPCPPLAGDLDSKLQALFNCCVNTNRQLCCQARSAEKCCSQLRHRIHTIKELIEDQSDDSAECCSVLEGLAVSQIDQSAACCSTIEAQISNLNLSVAAVFVLLRSVYDCTCFF